MIETVALSVAPAGDVMVLDRFDDAAPDLGGVRALRVEPRRWWLLDAGVRAAAEGEAVAPIGGGLVRATLTGPGWRSLLMIAGLFDAEDPGFGPGAVAATVVHHVPVWIAPVASDTCEVYFAASYAQGLVDLWTAAIARAVGGDHD